MIGTKPVYHAITDCDLFLMLGADYPYSAFLRPKGAVVQVDERAQALGKAAPANPLSNASPGPRTGRDQPSWDAADYSSGLSLRLVQLLLADLI
jgi:hypothetical protein